jgi:hypothetical protein
MVYDELPHEQLPELYEPNWESLKKATTESPHMEAAFYLLKEGMHWFVILSGLKPPTSFGRNDAILRGLVVRQCKLLRLALRELSSKETFQQRNSIGLALGSAV